VYALRRAFSCKYDPPFRLSQTSLYCGHTGGQLRYLSVMIAQRHASADEDLDSGDGGREGRGPQFTCHFFFFRGQGQAKGLAGLGYKQNVYYMRKPNARRRMTYGGSKSSRAAKPRVRVT
jgi:hypothetical protein